MKKSIEQIAVLLKGQSLDMPGELTDSQIINRVYSHFGRNAHVFLNDEWVRFVRKIIREQISRQ